MKAVFLMMAMAVTGQAQAGVPSWQTHCVAEEPGQGGFTIFWGNYVSQGENNPIWKNVKQKAEVAGTIQGVEISEALEFTHGGFSTRCGFEHHTNAPLAGGGAINLFEKNGLQGSCGGEWKKWTIELPGQKPVKLSCHETAI